MTIGFLVGFSALAVTALLFVWSLCAATPCTCPDRNCPKHGDA